MISIKNIYNLLCYAWNKLEESELGDVSAEDESELLNLLASVLMTGAKTLLKRGIDRQYITENEVYQGIKGKVNITHSLFKNLFSKWFSICEFDEISADILPNHILKTTLQNLIKTAKLSPLLKQEIRTIIYRLLDINEIFLTDSIFYHVQINRKNSFYAFLLNISELIYNNLLINEEHGNFLFKDFVRDGRQLATLFEEFFRNFYRIEVPEVKVF